MAAPRPASLLAELRDIQTREGSVRFDDFMELVLYHPTLGYFSKDEHRAGRRGDFLTSPEVSPLFGACVWQWLAAVWKRTGSNEFHVIEVGSGRGTLAAAILEASGGAPGLALHLVERGVAPRRALEGRFPQERKEGRVVVYPDVADLPPRFTAGAFVSNELFDNLSVRRVMKADGLKEIRIRIDRGRPNEVLVDAPADLSNAVQEQGILLSQGQTAEVSLRAVPLLEAVLSRIERGGLLAFDYGGEADEVSGDAAPQGTLMAHRGHTGHRDYYAVLGEQDVSAHVNFTPLRQCAERLRFAPARLQRQSQFLLEHGLAERFLARVNAEPDPLGKLRLTQLSKQLYHPEAMGDAFRVLLAERSS